MDARERRREEATDAIHHIGTNALPCLLKWINYEPRPGQHRLETLVDHLPAKIQDNSFLQSLLRNRDQEQAETASVVFSILGPEAHGAVPALTRLMLRTNRPVACYCAMEALSSLGPDALPPLLDVINSPRFPHRRPAIEAVGFMHYMGTNASPAVPVLAGCIKDSDPAVAETAAAALGKLQIEAELSVPALEAGLQGTNEGVRVSAANSLAKFKAQASPAVPLLIRCMKDKNLAVAEASVTALNTLHLEPDLCVPALVEALQGTNGAIRWHAALALAKFGVQARPAVPALVNCSKDQDVFVAEWAIFALGHLHLDPELSVPALTDGFRHANGNIRFESVRSLTNFGARARPAVPALLKALGDPDPLVRKEVRNTLRQIAPETLAPQAPQATSK
jgi:HEAT repeat protein